ncbi:glycosyltransferase family A protein [Haloterrigena salina]|nr:glycosyltransferase [Haloterrigena salina]
MTDSDTPIFSVCLCTFNDAETIEACLDSILPQLDHRYELVVTDGGSVDGTLEHVKERSAKSDVPIRIFTQEEPGLGVARQVCVDNARGDYLLEQVDADMVFADCFDELVKFYLETVETEGPFQLYTKGLRITPQELHEELGGWRPFPHGFQENELTRRFFGHGYLRLMDVRVAKHLHPEFGFETAVRRYLYNYREKLRCGISLRYAYEHLYTSNLPIWRKLLDTGTILLTYLWGLNKEHYETFDKRDPLAYEIDKELYEGCEEGTYEDIRLTPPQHVDQACFNATEDKVYSLTDA